MLPAGGGCSGVVIVADVGVVLVAYFTSGPSSLAVCADLGIPGGGTSEPAWFFIICVTSLYSWSTYSYSA